MDKSDLLQSLVDDAGATDVGEPGRATVALADAALAAAHVQSGIREEKEIYLHYFNISHFVRPDILITGY